MPTLVNSGSGNFTGATTWNLIPAVTLLDSAVSTTATPTVFTNGSPFVPGAITIDGIGIRVSTRSFSTGTVSVRLVTGGGAAGTTTGTAVPGTTVTANTADVPSGWTFFKFAAPVTLLAATQYNVQLSSTTNNALIISRDATASNWSRFLRSTTIATPVAGDDFFVVGDNLSPGSFVPQTVVMDNTSSTVYSTFRIGLRGTLAYDTAPSTAYRLRLAGNCDVNGGTLTIGTPIQPIPDTSTADLEFVVTTNVQFGLRAQASATITTHGAPKIGRAYLAANAASGATSLTTDVATNWRSGDFIVLASTTRNASETESRTLTANAVGTTLSSTALAFAHSGTAPTSGEIANFTRNVRIFGQSATLQTHVNVSSGDNVISFNYTEFYFMGSATTQQRGIDVNTITGSFAMNGCALRNFEATGSVGISINNVTGANIVIDDCVIFRTNTSNIASARTTASSNSITNVWGFGPITTANNFNLPFANGTLSNITAISSLGAGYGFFFNAATVLSTIVVNGLTAKACAGGGFFFQSTVCTEVAKVRFNNLTAQRNLNSGIVLQNISNYEFDGGVVFGNSVAGISFAPTQVQNDIIVCNYVINSGTVLTQPVGVQFQGDNVDVIFENCTLGTTSQHSTGDLNFTAVRPYLESIFRDCTFGSTVPLANQTNLLKDSFIGSQNHNGILGNNLGWTKTGNILKDSARYDTTTPGTFSTRLTPNSATLRLRSPLKSAIIPNGKALRVSVKIRWSSVAQGDSATYGGAPNNLVMLKNSAIGLNSDVILDTLTGGSFTDFVTISGTTPVATDNGVLSFYVDCLGTGGGHIWVDSWSVEVV